MRYLSGNFCLQVRHRQHAGWTKILPPGHILRWKGLGGGDSSTTPKHIHRHRQARQYQYGTHDTGTRDEEQRLLGEVLRETVPPSGYRNGRRNPAMVSLRNGAHPRVNGAQMGTYSNKDKVVKKIKPQPKGGDTCKFIYPLPRQTLPARSQVPTFYKRTVQPQQT